MFGSWARACHCFCQLTRWDFGKDAGGEAKGFEQGCESNWEKDSAAEARFGAWAAGRGFLQVLLSRREMVAQTKSTRIGFY